MNLLPESPYKVALLILTWPCHGGIFHVAGLTLLPCFASSRLGGEGKEVSDVMPHCHQTEHEQLQRLVLCGYPKVVLLQTTVWLDVQVPCSGNP